MSIYIPTLLEDGSKSIVKPDPEKHFPDAKQNLNMNTIKTWLSRSAPKTEFLIIPVVVGYPVLLLALTGIAGLDIVDAWELLGVPAMPVPFADLLNVATGIDCLEEGRDPFHDGSCDPFNRVFLYPKLWVQLKLLGFSTKTLPYFAIVISVAFFVAAFSVLRPENRAQFIVYFACLASPPVWLAVERGNTDLLIFPILVLAMIVGNLNFDWRRYGAALISVFAVSLKVYPIFLFPLYLESKRRSIGPLLFFLILSGLVIGIGWEQIENGIAYDTAKISYAFGSAVVFNRAADIFGFPGIFKALHFIAIGLGASAIVAALYKYRTILKATSWRIRAGLNGDMFLCGSSIYTGLFLTTTAFDYKLIFLLLLFPQLFIWINDAENRPVRVISKALILMIVALYWSCSTIFFDSRLIKGAVFLINEALSWGIAVGVAFLVSLVLLDRLAHLVVKH